MRFDAEVAAATTAVFAAASVVRGFDPGSVEVGRKSGGEVVTRADIAADDAIRAALAAAFPADAIDSEEGSAIGDRKSHRRLWIVDPLDGTSSFLAGGEYAISVGLAVDGRALVGAVYAPVSGLFVAGAVGTGVRVNGSPGGVADARLEEARVTASRRDPLSLRGLRLRPRPAMSLKLARVAAGFDHGTVSFVRRKPWGICAGLALVAAGGGVATLLDGGEIGLDGDEPRQPLGLVAAGPRLHASLLDAAGGVLTHV